MSYETESKLLYNKVTEKFSEFRNLDNYDRFRLLNTEDYQSAQPSMFTFKRKHSIFHCIYFVYIYLYVSVIFSILYLLCVYLLACFSNPFNIVLTLCISTCMTQ